MDIMTRVAKNHQLTVLLHEKPFARINGSGKTQQLEHGYNTGVNLLSPEERPKQPMCSDFFVNTIKAVHGQCRYSQGIYRSAGNDHRLGANEALPPLFQIHRAVSEHILMKLRKE